MAVVKRFYAYFAEDIKLLLLFCLVTFLILSFYKRVDDNRQAIKSESKLVVPAKVVDEKFCENIGLVWPC